MSASAICRRYWTAMLADGCWIDGRPAQVAHAHSGSIVLRMQEPKAKGKKLARYDWLVLPLCPECHYELDANVRAWEARHMPQARIIDELGRKHGLDLWALAAPTKQIPNRWDGASALALRTKSA